MTMNHLLDLLKAWSAYMKQSTSKSLGYPNKSSGMYGGGTSTSFDEMYESMTADHVKTIDAIIHSLPERQQNAVYHRYLGSKAEVLQDYHMNMAYDNLLNIATRRIPN
jgi:hypothetical protein